MAPIHSVDPNPLKRQADDGRRSDGESDDEAVEVNGSSDSSSDSSSSDSNDTSDTSDCSSSDDNEDEGKDWRHGLAESDLAHQARMEELYAENRHLQRIVTQQDRVLEEMRDRTREIQEATLLRQQELDSLRAARAE